MNVPRRIRTILPEGIHLVYFVSFQVTADGMITVGLPCAGAIDRVTRLVSVNPSVRERSGYQEKPVPQSLE